MHITNFVLKAVFSVAVLSLSAVSFAHNGEDHSVKSTTTAMPMNQAQMKHDEMDHSQHSAQEHTQHMQMMGEMKHEGHSAYMNHQAQPVNDQQQGSTKKPQGKNTQKGDHHAQH